MKQQMPSTLFDQNWSKQLLIVILVFALFVFGCQNSSDDGDSGGTPDTTAPTTSASLSANCTLSGTTYNCSGSVTISFTASESATVYYAQATGSAPSVSTSSSSAPFDLTITAVEKTTIYVKYFASDSAGNNETAKQLILYFLDVTTPTSSIESVKLTVDSSTDCSFDNLTDSYTCQGPANVKIAADETSTIYYTTAVGSLPADPSTDSLYINSGLSFPISTSDTYVKYLAVDTATNAEVTIHSFDLQINGISANLNGGYYNTNQGLTLEKSDSRTISGSGNYRIYYRMFTDPDVSGDTSGDTVFTGSPPVPDASSTLHFNTFSDSLGSYPNGETIQASASEGETKIYQIKYNLIYGDTQSGTTPFNITDGTADKESSLVLIIDKDKPRLLTLPPSSGTLSSSLAVMPFLQDQGIDMMNAYKSTNSTLSDSTADDSGSAKYCKVVSYNAYENTSVFWDNCSSYNTIPSGTSIQNITSNTYVALTGQDIAGNTSDCDVTNQFTCETAAAGFYPGKKHLVEYYTPGIQLSEIFHDSDMSHTPFENTNFGHSVAIGNLDNGTTNNDIVIGAPAYSYTDGTTTSKARGAVYIWYNGFRERATKRLALGDATIDVSGVKWLEFKTDGGTALRVNLDPSNDTSGLATSSDYSDKTQATVDEIANYLNRAFLNSFGTNGNHLYALPTNSTGDIYTSDSTGDGYVTIGHINRTIDGYFSIASSDTFDASSDFNYGGGVEKTIRAYDYAVFGENDNDEFGYSVAIDTVDTSPDASYSSKHVIVGAPGYNFDVGALYIIQVPASDASTDYNQIKLESGEDELDENAYRIEATSDGRLGTALAFHDKNSDGIKEIYVSAPYHDGGATNGGAVYQIGKDFVFNNPADTTTDISDGSTVTDSVFGTLANGLFGYSMVAGETELYSEPHLYVGSPGREKASDVLGTVKAYDIESGAFSTSYRGQNDEDGGIDGNLYGFSLAIISNSFDASADTKCPCLLVGSPGSQSENGRVYILGDFFRSYVNGSSSEKLGISLVTSGFTTLADSEINTDIVFIGSRNNHKGQVTVLYKQGLQHDVALTEYSGLQLTPTGNELGDNLGNSIAILHLADLTKALITGLAGEHYESVSSTTIYRMGNENYRKGGVRIYSFNWLGF